jgi:hypothetical protein
VTQADGSPTGIATAGTRDLCGQRAASGPAVAAGMKARLAPHLTGLGVLAAITVVTMRRFIATGGIPAGTDMLGFVSRAAQNASLGRILDTWSPSSFGARRVFSFDNILGALTLLTRNPVATVKLLAVAALFGAGLAAYALAWSWYRRRLAAATAGVLYMASQASLTHWGSGMLNVEVIIALAPVMLLTWSSCLERFTLPRAVGLTSALGAGLLIRPDLVLYVVPFLGLYAVAALSTRERLRPGLAAAARTLAVAVPGVLLLNAAWLLPSLAGYRPQYETLHQLFSIGSLYTRSIDFYPSLLGFGREIGYFGFSGTETWYFYPGLPLWGYYAFGTLVPLLAYSALWWHRDRRTVFLVLASVLATLAAPGTRAPAGGLYLWAARHIPIAANLRDPNRWLIVQAVAYALLASLTIERAAAAARDLRARHRPRDHAPVLLWAIPRALTLALVGAALVPVLPTVVIGLRTWHVTRPQQALLGRIRDTTRSGAVASVPFGQDYQYLIQGSYRGYEHDLGYESALFTGQPAIGDGSWNQRSANFIAYEATLLSRASPAFTAMLASAGVTRVISFNYPLAAPQLLGRTVGPHTQQHAVARLPGLTPLLSNQAGTDYAVSNAAPPLSLRRDTAVVLGGSQGIAALASRPGFELPDWAVFTADDIIATRGYAALLSLLHRAGLVLLADERPADIAVQGTRPLTKLAGITSDPQTDRLVTDVPTDQSAQTGSLSDLSSPIPQPQTVYSSSVFTVRSPQRVEIWARARATPLAATIEAHIGGTRVGSITPVTLGTGGFGWFRVAAARVGAGVHRVTLSAVPSRFGSTYEVAQARVLDPGALRSSESQLSRALAGRAAHVAYSFNLADAAKWAWPALAPHLGPVASPAFSLGAWKVSARSKTTVTTTAAPGGTPAPQFIVGSRRSVNTAAEIRYRQPRDWGRSPYIFLEFKGSGGGQLYSIAFSSRPRAHSQARYVIADSFRGWRTLAFSTADPGPGSGTIDWSHVDSVHIALASKGEPGTFALGVPRPSRPVTSMTVPLPVPAGTPRLRAAIRRPACTGGFSVPPPGWLRSRHALVLPVSSLRPTCSIYVRPRAGYRQFPLTAVRLHRTGIESWSYSFSARQAGVLVWTQAYDPLWVRQDAGRKNWPLPVQSLLNGYLAGPGRHFGTIGFAGESTGMAGTAVTALSTLALLAMVAWLRRRRPAPHSAVDSRAEPIPQPPPPAPLRHAIGLCLTVGSVLLVLCPAASLMGRSGVLLPLSSAALLAFGAAAVLIGVGQAGLVSARSGLPKPK